MQIPITHPLHLSQRLFDLFRRSGGTFVKTNVTGFRNGPDGEPIRLSTDGESLPVDGLVIAAGAFSNRSQNRPARPSRWIPNADITCGCLIPVSRCAAPSSLATTSSASFQ